MITNIDENLGTLVQKLDEWGVSENTLLVYMTDDGSAAGWRIYNGGMKGGKGTVNQGGARVPLFMRLPGRIKAGIDVDRLTRHYHIDKDPGETTNVIDANPEVAAEMLKAYEGLWKIVRPTMVNEDTTLATGKPFVEQYNKQKATVGIPEWVPPEI